MSGWRFDDRGWFVNDALNLRTVANRHVVGAELEHQNVAFGVHRWFAGGSAADAIAITSLGEWDAALARGRPGDNVILMSLRQVEAEALAHAGDIASGEAPILSAADITAIEVHAARGGLELLFVRRFAPQPGSTDASSRWIDLRDTLRPWREAVAEHAVDGGEVWLFDGELLWRDHHRRLQGSEPPERWQAHHGIYVIDGYVPDEQGRVVCGGPY
jgi:hypothetical protein